MIIYGMGSKGLADQLEIDEMEAELYIEGYFNRYPGVQKWMKEQEKKIKIKKYTQTLLGRKRRVYEQIDSGVFWKIRRGIRQGINAVIQGSFGPPIQ